MCEYRVKVKRLKAYDEEKEKLWERKLLHRYNNFIFDVGAQHLGGYLLLWVPEQMFFFIL